MIAKRGPHGTLYLYEIEYADGERGRPDPASPVFTTRRYAYNREHAIERFYSGDDTGWAIVRIARVSDKPRHRWTWIRNATT